LSILSELQNLKAQHIALYVGAFLGTVAPGFLIIYYFRPELIERYDIFKLTFFSVSMTLPLLVVNLALIWSDIKHTEDIWPVFLLAFGVNFVVLYIALIVVYFFSLGFKFYLGIVAFLELVLLLRVLVDVRKRKKKETA
jgi:hypothetical protein